MKEKDIKKFNQEDVDNFIREQQRKGHLVYFKDIEFVGESIHFRGLSDENMYRFSNCKFSNIKINSDYTSNSFHSSRFTRCIFFNCSIYNLNAFNAYFNECIFKNISFFNVNISYSDFTNSVFKGNIYFKYGVYIGCSFPWDAFNISYTLNATGLTSVCPQEGSFIGYKKAYYKKFEDGWLIKEPYIVKLLIPEDAKRSSSTSRKCRYDKAKVLSITNLDGTETDVKAVYSYADKKFTYTVGETVEVKNFDENRWHECAPGIHFWMDRIEAVEYNI